MRVRVAKLCGWLVLTLTAIGALASVNVAGTSTARTNSEFIGRYCVSCHRDPQRPAGVTLGHVDVAEIEAEPALWERVVRQVRAGTMPPVGARRPDRPTTTRFAASVEDALDAAARRRPDPGPPVARRLTRNEYANAIRDVLALDIDVESLLPADESLGGFDSNGGLSISPALLERYLSAARRISRLAAGDITISPAFASRTYKSSPTAWQQARIDDAAPFGSRGGLAVRHLFPLDGQYVVRLRLRRNIFGYVRGLGDRHELEVRVDGRRIGSFSVGGERKGAPAPLSFTGVFPGDPAWEAYALAADDHLELQFRVAAGPHTLVVTFVEEVVEEEGVARPPLTGLAFSFDESSTAPEGPRGPAVDGVEIDGPYHVTGAGETPSRARLFTCRPSAPDESEPCARTILTSLTRLFYRRPATPHEIDTLVGFFRAVLDRQGFDEGIRFALERLLVDPNFLVRVERNPAAVPPGTIYRVNGYELASRLAFFLWASVPDADLLATAASDDLRDANMFARQVHRMLGDGRAGALVETFASQWLSLRRLREVTPDPALFNSFDDDLRNAFQRETELFLASQISEDRPLVELLTADYTFLNERLARHYEIPGVFGSQFRRVALGTSVRGGLLGQGSILAFTSYPTRTSPVLRGRWVLDTILGTPPAAPPPDIPPLPANHAGEPALSLRARTEQHRSDPRCAACHARMDPLGFALDNFDAIGRWRLLDEDGALIDASGASPDGTNFTGVSGLRRIIVDQPEMFAQTAVEKLLTYALGRTLEPNDMPAVRRIVKDSAADGYRWSSIIIGVASSVPFQMRRAGA